MMHYFNHRGSTSRFSTCEASIKFTIAAAQSMRTCGWSRQRENSRFVAPKQAAVRSLDRDRGGVAVETLRRQEAQIARPILSPSNAVEERHLLLF